MDSFAALPVFAESDEIKAIHSALSKANEISTQAMVLKVEAMLVTASKNRLRRTQRDLVAAQLAEIAGSEIDENLVQPGLLAFAKSTLA